MKYGISLLFGCLLLANSLDIWAKQTSPAPDVKAETREQFTSVASHVHEQMEPGGRFAGVTATQRETVTRDLAGMQALFDKFERVDSMDTNAKIQLYNAQSEVNAILTRNDGDREICTQEMPTGSNIPKTTCRKYRDIERDRAATLKAKQDMLQVPSLRVPQPNSKSGGK